MKKLALALIATVMTFTATGCVTTASMYVEKDMNPTDDIAQVESFARQDSDTRARIQIDMKKEWK